MLRVLPVVDEHLKVWHPRYKGSKRNSLTCMLASWIIVKVYILYIENVIEKANLDCATIRLGTRIETIRLGTRIETIRLGTRIETIRLGTRIETIRLGTRIESRLERIIENQFHCRTTDLA